MKLIYLLVSALILYITGCHSGTKGQTNSELQNHTPKNQVVSVSMKNTIGVISLNKNRRGDSHELIRLFNNDSSIWYEFPFFEDSQRQFNGPHSDFQPFAYNRDYFLLVLKCTRSDFDRYEVLVNETSGLRKFVRKDDLNLKFYTWEEHIIKNVMAVENNDEENPLISAPYSTEKLYVTEDNFMYPDKIDGDWLRVKWNESEFRERSKKKVKQIYKYGWMKWKNGDNIIIELFYYA